MRVYRKHQHHKRDSGFLVIKIQEHFQFSQDWYRHGAVRPLVGQYYVVLRAAMRARTEVRKCVRRCRQCGIFFLTHPRNAGREDLRCPFGCKDAHRKLQSTKRSTEYYGTTEGKTKKKIQNGKRGNKEAVDAGSKAIDDLQVECGGIGLDSAVVGYVRMVTSLIERRRVSEDEILEMLFRILRQHSIARRRRLDYVVAQLRKNAP